MSDIESVAAKAQQELAGKIDDLPLSLTARDVADFLGICLTTAYKLVSQDGFPCVKMPGVKRVVIPKVRFIEWYMNNGSGANGEAAESSDT